MTHLACESFRIAHLRTSALAFRVYIDKHPPGSQAHEAACTDVHSRSGSAGEALSFSTIWWEHSKSSAPF